MSKKSNLFFLIILICFTSCDKKRIFDQYQSVGQTWHKDSVVSFSFSQKDTLKLYNLFVNLRNNNKYPYNNLFLIVALEQPNKQTIVDTLEYQMANADGSQSPLVKLISNPLSGFPSIAIFAMFKNFLSR